jgi:hypothetical protein
LSGQWPSQKHSTPLAVNPNIIIISEHTHIKQWNGGPFDIISPNLPISRCKSVSLLKIHIQYSSLFDGVRVMDCQAWFQKYYPLVIGFVLNSVFIK